MCVSCLALCLVGVWESGDMDVTPIPAIDQLCSWKQVPATLHFSILNPPKQIITAVLDVRNDSGKNDKTTEGEVLGEQDIHIVSKFLPRKLIITKQNQPIKINQDMI